MPTTRRDVLRLAACGRRAGPAGITRRPAPRPPPKPLPDATPKHLPRWRGFNLLNKFMADGQKPFEERDFADIAELGFDFVRLPLDYRCWTDPGKPGRSKSRSSRRSTRRSSSARSTAFTFRSTSTGPPGSPSPSPPSRSRSGPIPRSWKSAPATGRPSPRGIKGRPNNEVSFNLFNEPDDKVKPEDHRRVIERVAAAIRERDPKRLIVCDGRAWATAPPDGADRPGRGGRRCTTTTRCR